MDRTTWLYPEQGHLAKIAGRGRLQMVVVKFRLLKELGLKLGGGGGREVPFPYSHKGT